MPLNPGDTLLNGQYRILRLLGRGGFGFVYQAEDTLLRDEVAIKELIPALVGDDAVLKRFLAEAKATMRLAHEHIVRTHNVFQEGGNYYIVMECMAGGSLEERLREKGSLPVEETVRIASEVCAGLDYAHRRGIVHCDLKPPNILFDKDGTAKVADFGIAHVSGEMLTRSWMTPAGFVAGTLPYMSPEQADGVREDPRIDVYALGAVLYRALTGRSYLDFDQRETPGAQADNVYHIRNAEPNPPSAHDDRIPAWLDEVVLKALSKHPEERYSSAAEMQAVLERRGAVSPAPPQTDTTATEALARTRLANWQGRAAETQAAAETRDAASAIAPQAETEAAMIPPRPPRVQRPRPIHRAAWFWPVVAAAGVLLIAVAVGLWMLSGEGKGGAETRTPEPTQVAVVEPTATSTLAPTDTPAATDTPRPAADTLTPNLPAATARPTSTRIPPSTATPKPTNTPVTPTDTPMPATNTPKPTAIPAGPARIAFHSDRDGNYEIYIMNVDGSGQTRLTNRADDDSMPAWSPDGRRIAFLSRQGGNVEIYVMNADGTGAMRLTDSPAPDYSHEWSPDGKRIVFQSGQDGNYEIYVMNADGSGKTNLTNNTALDCCATWSPNGKRITFASERDGDYEIYIMNADGSGVTRLTDNQADDYGPHWSPDGRRIAFRSNRDGNYEVYVMNADGSGQTRLTDNAAEVLGPAWSPDGTRIAFESGRDGNKEIYITNADGSGQIRLTDNPADDRSPAWSPDGTRIAFYSVRDGNWEIYVMDADGTQQTRLTNNPGSDAYPVWSP